jgi:hypothetical protein
MVRLRLVVKV